MTFRSPISGFLLGALLPLLGAGIVYVLLFKSEFSFDQYSTALFKDARLASKVLALAIIPNMLAMMYFNRRRQSEALRGLMAANVIWIVLFILQRFVWS